MLRSLYIQNYALIEKLDISFSSGFSVITGETGAGKSIILGAIGLLLGQRADVKAIRVGASKCIIEARFDISAYGMQPFFGENELEYEEECLLRREVSASGKSRAFINDTPASLAQMKELGEQLIDVHSQHQNLLLNKEGFQLNVLDILSHNEEALSAYQHIFGAWKQAQQDLEALVARANQDKSDEDYIRFQLEQLEEAHLSAGEQEELEQEADTLSHAEEIKAGLYRVGQTLYSDEGGLLSGLKECLNTMLGLQRVYPVAGELAELRAVARTVELQLFALEIRVADTQQQVLLDAHDGRDVDGIAFSIGFHEFVDVNQGLVGNRCEHRTACQWDADVVALELSDFLNLYRLGNDKVNNITAGNSWK